MAACLHMAVDGIGIAALPVAIVSKAIAAGELTRVHYPWVPQPLPFQARYDAAIASGAVAKAAALAREVASEFAKSVPIKNKNK